MRPRGNCPECRLRDVTHIVEQEGQASIELCKLCAWSYEFPARITPLEA
jgi:hypothetical protein